MSVLLPALALVLIGGQLVARLATRLGLPAVFGELVLGLALGPLLVRWLDGAAIIGMLGNLGVLLLMLLVGLETDVPALRGIGVPAFLAACCGAILPFLCGGALGLWLRQPLVTALFVGVALSATSVSITAATLRELGRLDSRSGRTIMMAAVIDDVLGLLLLAFVTGQSGGQSPALAVARVLLVGVLALASGWLCKPALRLLERHSEGFLAVAVGIGFLCAWGAQALGGLAPITGAYAGGLLLARAVPRQSLAWGVETLASGFFATIFFVSLGLQVRVDLVSPALLGVFLALAIATKVVGCGVGARLGGLPWREVLAVGVGMVPRGEVALIVASQGLQAGVLSTGVFSLLVLVTAGTTVLTPVLLNGVYALAARRAPAGRSLTDRIGETELPGGGMDEPWRTGAPLPARHSKRVRSIAPSRPTGR